MFRQQPFRAGELAKPAEQISQILRTELFKPTGAGGGLLLLREHRKDILGRDLSALVETIGLTGKSKPPLSRVRVFACKGIGLAPFDFGVRAQPGARQLGPHLQAAFFAVVVGAGIALIHQWRFARVQFNTRSKHRLAGAGMASTSLGVHSWPASVV